MNNLLEHFKRANPGDSMVVYQFQENNARSYYGQQLLNDHTYSGRYWQVFKLSESSAEPIKDEEIKYRVFPIIYETQNVIDNVQRRNIITKKLNVLFPKYYVNVFVFDNGNWSRHSFGTKGRTYFEKMYGSEVDIILN